MADARDRDAADPAGDDTRQRSSRAELREQLRERRADLERQLEQRFEVGKAQLDAGRAQFEHAQEVIKARTGRNLLGAIVIGLILGLSMLFSLIFVKALFMAFIAVIAALACSELVWAVRRAQVLVPRIPTVIAALASVPAAYYFGVGGLFLSVLAGSVLVALWRLTEQLIPSFRARPHRALWLDLAAGTFIQAWVPLLAGFAVALTAEPGGQWWTVSFIVIVICADTGAYAAGLSFGRHPMAPVISPKKTWEGFAGAAVAVLIAGVLLAVLLLQVPWWVGAVLGAAILLSATLGDLAESLVKRDLGVKDMSSWLPGHGGFLDRLDSMLPSSVVTFLLFAVFH
ncbi:MAG TPA: phosphatidate cytidylyltransferase [Candidatus Lumbricidophila sp.]|nr:phosphatidate cytidylyltransferase [Candidatus Lumbricidophila sp.]